MAWKDTIWLKNKLEHNKILVGSNSSICKSFDTAGIAQGNDYTTVGTFTPKFSGTVTIISELWQASSQAGQTGRLTLKADNTIIYNESVISFPYTSNQHNYIYITISVTKGEEYTLYVNTDNYNTGARCIISVGATLSEMNIVE